MTVPKMSEDLRPLSDMKSSPGDVVGQVRRTGRPVYLTRYGKGVAVVLSLEAYEELQVSAAKMKLIAALRESERAVLSGDVVDHSEVDEMLKAWESDA
jgi:prevent-host-death family protein